MVVASVRERGRTELPISVLARAQLATENPPAIEPTGEILFDGTRPRHLAAVAQSSAVFSVGTRFLSIATSLHNQKLYDRAAVVFEIALRHLPLEEKRVAMKGKGDALFAAGQVFSASLAYMDEGALCEEAGRDSTEAYLRARELLDGPKESQAASPYWLLQRAVILLSLAHAQTHLENLAIAKGLRSKALDLITGHLVQTGAILRRDPNSAEVHGVKAEIEAAIGNNSSAESRKALERVWDKIESTSGDILTSLEILALDSPFAAEDMFAAASRTPDILNGGLSLFQMASICPPPFAMPFARAV